MTTDLDKELGPENKEACNLIHALHKSVDTSLSFNPDAEENSGEDWENSGVGKDYLGKYSYVDIKVEGVEYRVVLRDKKDFQHENEKLTNVVNFKNFGVKH